MSKVAAREGEKRALPGSYSEMYPNRFLKADLLKGAKVTLTIKDIVGEGLMSEDGGANLEWIASFMERPLQLVVNKTNAFCLYRMFGGDPHSWIGKRITLFPTTVKAFGATQDCIRVWGSPDIPEDLPITIPQGRKKKLEMTMHKVTLKSNGSQEGTVPAQERPSRDGLEPRILVGLDLLGEAKADEFLRTHSSYSAKDMLAALNKLLDEAA
jgi:hypothetical protein